MVEVLVKNKTYRVTPRQAKVLVDIGRGTYLTRDMQAQPVAQPVAQAAAPAEPEAVEYDSEGQAWNADIHAADHARTQAGTWAKKRGRKADSE